MMTAVLALPSEYNVALRYNENAGGYAGIVTWSSFESKAEFDSWFAAEGSEQREQEVVAEGITQEEAVALCKKTPLMSYVKAAIEDATDMTTGEVDLRLAKARMATVAIAIDPQLFENIN